MKNPLPKSLTASTLICLSVLFPLGLSACKPHAEADDHDHDTPHAAPEPRVKADASSDHAHDEHDHKQPEGEHADEVVLTPDAIKVNGIEIENAKAQPLTLSFIAPGRVAFNQDALAHIGSPLRGRASELRVKVGQQVTKGDPLLIIESPELGQAQAEYFQRRVAAEASRPAAALAKLSWERARSLFEQSQGISLAEVQKREAEYQAALASQQAADAAAIGAENQLHLLGMHQDEIQALAKSGEISPRFTISAPIDGVVIEREVTLGELVGPEREALIVLADMTTLWVLADIPEARLAELAIGAKAWVSVGSAVHPGRAKLEGHVMHLGAVIDPMTRTAQARVDLASPTLRPGMFASVELESSEGAEQQASTIMLPDEAIQLVEGATSVFVPVPGEANTFARRAVTTGKTAGGKVQILAGLREGEPVVVTGSFILKAELGKAGAEHSH